MIEIIVCLVIYFICDKILQSMQKPENTDEGPDKSLRKQRKYRQRRRVQNDISDIDKEIEEFIMFEDINDSMR